MNQAAFTKKVEWKDLVKLGPRKTIIENTITLPWLLGSWILAARELYYLALPCSFLFFLCGLRQMHNGFHHSLGTGKRATWISMYINSILMLVSAQAVKFSHLRHHKYCLGPGDHEGRCARMNWYQAILYGPVHIYTIHRVVLQLGNKHYKRDVLIEIISILSFAGISILLQYPFLIYHCIAMLTGEFFSAFFAVWTVHHHLEDHLVARTQRTRWKNFITYNMFYHLEHHLFPAVPTINLPELARRIDEAIPELEKKQTF